MATFNSNLIATNSPGKQGVYPLVNVGTVVIPGSTTLAANDTMPLCNLAVGTYVKDLQIDFPVLNAAALVVVQDNQGTPLVYIPSNNTAQAGGNVTGQQFAHGVLGTVYQTNQQLLIRVATGGAVGASPVTIYFVVEVASA